MTAPNTMAKRAAAGTLALAVCFTGGLVAASTASADATFKFDQRFGGADRFETAVNASKAAFAGGAGDVIIVQDDALADGLTASYLAGLKKAPILYVKKDSVPAATSAELDRLKAERIFIVGGTAVVSSGVQSSLGTNGRNVSRVSGSDRFETAARVATSGSNGVGTVFIANGDAPADALAGGPIAYKSNNPILLTRSMSVPSSTAAALRQLDETNRIVLGGNAVVSTSTYTDLDANNRLAGKNRQGTAVAIADYAVANEGFNRANAALVGPEDRNTADALIAAPFAGQTGTPILFTARDGISDETTQYLKANAAALTGEGYIFGGTSAVSDADAAAATAAAGGDGTTPPVDPPTTPPGQGAIAVAPADAVTQVIATEGTQTERDDNRQYQATGLRDGVQYRVTLVDSNNVRSTNDGVTFRSSTDGASASGYSADTGTDYADIISVNGGNITGANTTTAVPVNGTIVFEIDGVDVGSVTPVIYVNGGPGKTAADGGESIRLETSATSAGEFAAATEPFGLGGQVTYVGRLAAEGPVTGTVASVDKDGNTFSTDTARFTYDDNDTFELGGQTVDLATFESQLSSGDTVSGTFVQNASGSSTFDLNDINPAPITGVTAERESGTDGTVTVEGTFPGDLREIDSFVVQRAAVGDSDDDEDTMDELGDFTTVATVPAADTDATAVGVQLRHVDQNVPSGEYSYRLAAVNDGDQGPFTASDTTVGASQDQATVLDTRLTQGGNTTAPFVLGTDDSFTIVASEDLDPIGDAQLRISDNDGTVGDFSNTVDPNDAENLSNATFTLNTAEETVGGETYPAGRVVTVDLDGEARVVSNQEEGVDTLGFPANITDSAGITDETGTKIALTGDVTLENDSNATNPNPGGGGANAAPVFTAPDTLGAGNTLVFTGTRPLNGTTVTADDVDIASANDTTVTSAVANGDDVTVTLSQAPAQGDTITLNGAGINSLAGTAGNNSATFTAPAAAGPQAQSAAFASTGGVAADFDTAGDTIVIAYDAAPLVASAATVTIGNVTLTNQGNVTMAVTGGTDVTITNVSANILAVADKDVTASDGITGAAGGADAGGYPTPVN